MFATFYQIGQALDRRFTKSTRVSRPVLAVGNISMGGRAKTPFVVAISKWLKENSYYPVVLTRGYGRDERKSVVWLEPEIPMDPDLKVTDTGDEALEIFYTAPGTTVLVGKDRVQNAVNYLVLQMDKKIRNKVVFLLDDGFQHWALERDFDLVLTDPKDYSDWKIPYGRLRESPKTSLLRADLVLKRGEDFEKKSELLSRPEGHGETAIVVTTRVADEKYTQFMKEQFPLVEFLSLRDHATTTKLQNALKKISRNDLIVGAKEAVKLLPYSELESFFKTGKATMKLSGVEKEFQLHFARCDIEINPGIDLWAQLKRVIQQW